MDILYSYFSTVSAICQQFFANQQEEAKREKKGEALSKQHVCD
jgi:hypothetical protein